MTSSHAEGLRIGPSSARPQPHPLTHIRRRHGWSYQELARVVADNARALGVPMAARREKVWRWEHWGVVPEPDSQRALARALGVPQHELDVRPWPGWLPAHGGVHAQLPWTVAGSLTALRSLVEDAPRDRRGAPVLAGRELRGAADDWASASTGGCVPPRGTGDGVVDEATADWLEQGAAGLGRLAGRAGVSPVLPRIEADLRLAAELLAGGSYSRAVGVRLLRGAADLAGLGGWACTDTGRHGAAQRYYLTGLRLAHSAGDQPLGALLLAGLGLQCVGAGQPDDALHLADTAIRTARDTARPRIRAVLAACRARAHAGLGDEAVCRKALAEAGEHLGEAGSHGDPPWTSWFDDAELAAQTGTCLLALGLPDEARWAFEDALADPDRDRGRDRPCDHALWTARAATAHLLAGDQDRGRRLGERAERLSGHDGSVRLAAAMDEFRALLGERDGPPAAGECKELGGPLPT